MLNAITPHLVVNDGQAAVEFYQKALGAKVEHTMPAPDGKRLMHAALKVGDAFFFLCDDFPEYCGGEVRAPKSTGHKSPVTMHLYVPDCDAAIAQAAAAGATVTMPAMDMFWGDRYGKILDPFGHDWSFAHHLSEERLKAAREDWAKKGLG